MELHSSDRLLLRQKSTPKEIKYKYLGTREPAITLVMIPVTLACTSEVDAKHYVIHQSIFLQRHGWSDHTAGGAGE